MFANRKTRLRAAFAAAVLPLALAAAAQAQTVLTAGDVAVIGLDKNNSPDRFAFVTLVDLAPGTVIYFTDNGWTGSGFRGSSATDGDGNENFTAVQILNNVPRGTIIRSSDTGPDFTWLTGQIPGTTSGSFSAIALGQGGEQIYAFQNTNPSNPLFNTATQTHLYVLDDTNGFEPATSSSTGDVPPGLSVLDSTAFTFPGPETDLAFNTSVLLSGTKADWLNAIANPSNWLRSSTDNLPSGSIAVVDSANPSVTSAAIASPEPYIANSVVTVQVNLSNAPTVSPATVIVSSPAFVSSVTVSITAPATSGTAAATLINQVGSPGVFTAFAQATGNATGGASTGDFTVFPTVWLTVDPDFRSNPAGGVATVPVTVFNGANPAPGANVSFSITTGPNNGLFGTETTNALGQAEIAYASNGTTGVDTVAVTSGAASSAVRRAWWSGQRVFLTEVFVNAPSGGDDGREFIEVFAQPSSSLAGYWVLGIEGDLDGAALPQPANGVVDHAVPLSDFLTGANGLLLIRDNTDILEPFPDAATSVGIFDFNPDLENGSVTWIVGYGNPPAVGVDLDANDDGVIDPGALDGFTVTDAIAYYVGEEGGTLYGTNFGQFGQNLPQEPPMGLSEQWTPDVVVRIFGPTGQPCSWAGADALGGGLGPFTLDLFENTGFAEVGIDNVGFLFVTPGGANPVSPAVLFQPAAQAVNSGDTISLNVQGFATSFQWRRNGNGLSNTGNISGATSANLSITNASVANAGTYDCVLTSPCGSVTTVSVLVTVDGSSGQPNCPGNFNNDGTVDLLDLLAFNAAWSGSLGQSVTIGTAGDYNSNGIVDLLDLLAFNADWSANLGQPCQ